MRILIHGINYSPEVVGIGKYTGEMAIFLAEQGHQVRIVTAPPYYPGWQIQPGYSGWQYHQEIQDGVRIFRCPLWLTARPSGLARIFHLASFAISSMPVMLAQAFWKPDLVVSIAPALAGAPFSWLTARLAGCRAWLHIQDFELDAAINLDLLPGKELAGVNRLFAQLLQHLEKWILDRFDRLSTISQSMLNLLWEKGVPATKTSLFPNWVDCQQIYPLPTPSQYREAWGIKPEQILVLYSGSMGHKQGLEILLEVAQRLQGASLGSTDRKLIFVLCGDGSARKELEMQAKNLDNVIFYPLQPVARLNELLNAADIHVLVQRANVANNVMPSKLTGMLASGKAVVATANPGTELARVVEQVGWLVAAEDPDSLYTALRSLAEQSILRHELGMKGRSYAVTNWDKQSILSALITEFNSLRV